MQDNKFFTSNPMYGHAYVPVQIVGTIFAPEVGLESRNNFSRIG